MDSLATVPRQFHAQLGRDVGVGKCRCERVTQRVKRPPADVARAVAFDSLQIKPRFENDALEPF
jgi:hypothetical protein